MVIIYSFSQAHLQENYLVYTNFNRNLRDSNKLITNLISDIQRQISSRVSDPCISHYLKGHGYIPLWVLNSILEISNALNIFRPRMRVIEEKQLLSYMGFPEEWRESLLKIKADNK